MDILKTVLLVAGFLIPLILSLVLINGSSDNPARRFMGYAFFIVSFVFFANYFYFLKEYKIYSWLHSLHVASVMWLFPFIFFYLDTLVRGSISWRKAYMHFLPGILFGLTSSILFYGYIGIEERIYYLLNYRMNHSFEEPALIILFRFRMLNVFALMVQIIVYSVLIVIRSRNISRVLNRETSRPEVYSVNWLKKFNIALIASSVASLVFYAFNPFSPENDIILVISLFVMASFIWMMGVWASWQQPLPAVLFIQSETFDSFSDSANGELFNQLSIRLVRFFENERPYLNPDLTLQDVARELGTNRTYLSRMINRHFNQNFSVFVNTYRAKEAKAIIKNSGDISQHELAQRAGFGSVSSMKRVRV